MNRPITPAVHGAVDYGFLVSQLAVPRLLRLNRSARFLFGAFGVLQGALNACTDQPLAIKRLVPFAVHGRIEKASAPIYVLAPILAGVVKDPRARGYWLGMGAVLVANFNLTDWKATPRSDTRS